MNIEEERKRFLQTENLQKLLCEIQPNEMVTVYLTDYHDSHCWGISCALIPSFRIKKALSTPGWDLFRGKGMPDTSVSYDSGKKTKVTYLRYGDIFGIEPLIIEREFHSVKESYREINEEFRLFHNLYHDRKTEQYIKIDDDGNETVVAEVKPNTIKIRLKEIQQFLAIKKMHLSIQFQHTENSNSSLEALRVEAGEDIHNDAHACWAISYGNYDGIGKYQTFSRLIGKRLIAPISKSKSGLWGFAEETKKKYVDFIIGMDKNGDEVTFTSNPNALTNYFGCNRSAPHYLTAVHFKKEVLDKYYQKPSKYSVENSVLYCGRLWSLTIDNHHEDKVCANLGDLGRDLSYEEQSHWRSYNVPPQGGFSETFFRSQFLAEFTESNRPEDKFKQLYHDLQKVCDEYLGWQLLLPLEADDEHHFKGMRIPATDEQSDFDQLVLGLTKILIDSLNEKQLKQCISPEQLTDLKGSIAYLDVLFATCGIQDFTNHIAFLRNLQSLRSSSSAHRKGDNYLKIAKVFGIKNKSRRSVFSEIFIQAISLLEFFISVARGGLKKK